ncbi:carbohydrate ABC transporter permease [Paenibacillus sp. 2TAB23]|uniref:carbohydrate ABC transporter permease n=1 Tax=Paenibacillus sp. 2TAB23 TaxID=3233004 RepID=UPI003F96D2CE
MRIQSSLGGRTFDVLNYLVLGLISFVSLVPILHVVAGAFSSSQAIIHNRVFLWPVDMTLDNIKLVVQTSTFWKAAWMTVKIVVIATTVNMVLTVFGAYPLSKSWLRGRKFFMLFLIFTMVFQAPMIPIYLVVKSLGLLNSLWALVIPSAVSAFNVILCLTFFRSLPEELLDAAKVDGMGEFRIVAKIVVPLSLPIIVTLLLFYAVGHWNSYMGPLMYLNDRNLQTLQLYIYSLISQGNSNDVVAAAAGEASISLVPAAIEMATIVLATAPIVLLYPFVQNYFIKGATLGSIKE